MRVYVYYVHVDRCSLKPKGTGSPRTGVIMRSMIWVKRTELDPLQG